MKNAIRSIPWPIILVLCATLGMAPVAPEPHLVEKTRMLFRGTLSRPIDIFDFLFHLFPFLLLAARLLVTSRKKNEE